LFNGFFVFGGIEHSFSLPMTDHKAVSKAMRPAKLELAGPVSSLMLELGEPAVPGEEQNRPLIQLPALPVVLTVDG